MARFSIGQQEVIKIQANQITLGESNPEYVAFIEKFKPKKTTDDCYTPENIYQAVLEFARAEYAIPNGARIIRPFWPGADYQAEDYSGECVVVDNPPFSILSEVCRWYMARGVRFFLFAPALTLFSTAAGEVNYVVCNASITYENGARVNTSFVTNLGEDKIFVCPNLNQTIKKRDTENTKERTRELPKYSYPDNATTAALLGYLAQHGAELRIYARDAIFVRALDAQRDAGKAMFGSGFLLSEKAAAEKAAAEKAAAEKAAAEKAAAEKAAAEKAAAQRWGLSEREKKIIRGLG
jgi:hypothetical protein